MKAIPETAFKSTQLFMSPVSPVFHTVVTVIIRENKISRGLIPDRGI